MAKLTTPQNSKKKTLREKAEKQKKAAVKAVLQNPFKTTWPSISVTKQQEVLEYLERLLQPLHDANLQDGKKKKKKKNAGETNEANPESVKIRSQFVIGTNCVTRMLEKDKLSLVLVCKSAHPPIIVKHLAELSAVRCCPAMLLNGLDTLLCSKLKKKSAVAIGFKKRNKANGYFKEFISSVNPPEIHFPYLNNHVAKFIIDKKGDKRTRQFGCENILVKKQSNNSYRKKNFNQNQTAVTDVARISKSCSQNENKTEKRKNPCKSNENFISLSSVSDDEELQGLNLKLRHVNTRDSIWEEIFAMRIVDDFNSKGISMQRKDVNPAEINSLKSSMIKPRSPKRNWSISGKSKKGSKKDFQKKIKIEGEKPEYRVSEIKRIKGNVDKKKMKKKKWVVKKENEKMSTKNDKNKKEKSHLNRKNKSKIKKLKNALKKLIK